MTTRSAVCSATVHATQRTRPWIAFSFVGLGQRQLVALAVELVGAVLDPVRPRDQHLPAPRMAHLLGRVAVDHVATGDGVRTDAAADLDDDRPLVLRTRSRTARRWTAITC